MFDENGLGDDGTDSAGPKEPGEGGDDMDDKDDEIAHLVIITNRGIACR